MKLPNHDTFCPDMNEQPSDTADFVSRLSYNGRHYILRAKTDKELSGRGIKDLGDGVFRATETAYNKVCDNFSVSYTSFLD